MKEKWFTYHRRYCIEGTIDIVHLDCNDNPNNDEKNPIGLNLIVPWIRFNNSDWYQVRTFQLHEILTGCELFTAEELKELYDTILNIGTEVSLQN